MSSGIEVFILLPFLIPFAGSGGAAVGTVGVAATGSAVGSAIGAPVITSGAISAGGMTAGAGASSAAGAGAAVGAVGVAASCVMVAGAAGIALLAAHQMQNGYAAALCAHRARMEAEQAGFRVAQQQASQAGNAVRQNIRRSNVQAAESAELLFLQAGTRRLRQRLNDWPGVDPRLPDGCMALLHALESPSPDFKSLFAGYQSLNAAVAAWSARHRQQVAREATSSATSPVKVEALRQAIHTEIESLRAEIVQAPTEVLENVARRELTRLLAQVKHLGKNQPLMAEQSLQLLRSRVSRALSQGAERAVKRREEQAEFARRLRELSAHISARSQVTLEAIERGRTNTSAATSAQMSALQMSALEQLKRLASLLAGELPTDLAPLERLSREADALFESTHKHLQDVAKQIYLQEQVAEVFSQLGYHVTTSAASETSTGGVLAALDGQRGVEVRFDENGNLSSEMVAFSTGATDIEPHAQDKVCALMDDVFDALRARGCTVREKKRRHFRKGERALRVVTPRAKKVETTTTSAVPQARRLAE